MEGDGGKVGVESAGGRKVGRVESKHEIITGGQKTKQNWHWMD